MLDVMRKSADSTVLKVLFVAIVLVFMFWGVGTVGTQHVEVAAQVNEEVITNREFQRVYERLQSMYQSAGAQAPPATLLRSQAIEQLIDLELLNQEADRLGIGVDEAELRDTIASSPEFQQDGRFDRERYVLLLQQNGYKPSDFEETQRRRLTALKVQELVRSGVHVSDQEVVDRFRYDNERVNLRYIRVPAAFFRGNLTVSDADVQQYFADNQERYREPERVRISLLEFRPDQIAARITPPDAEVQAYYDAHLTDYQRDEEARARHILFKVAPDAPEADKAAVRAKAEAVLAQVRGGADFIALAKEHSQDVTGPTGGDLGVFGRGVMTPAFETAVFAMEPGQISDIVETPFGLHIIRLEEKHPARTVPLEEVRPSIVEAIKLQQSRQRALQEAEKAHDQLLEGASIKDVAAAVGVPLQTPAPFGRTELVGTLGARPELAKQAFDTEVGEFSDIVSEPTGYSVFVVDEVIPTRIPELEAVRGKVEADVRTVRASEAAKKRAEELLTALKQKPDIEAVAQEQHLALEQSDQVGRAGPYLPGIGTSVELKEAAFKLTEAAPLAPAVYQVGDDAIVAVLASRVPADEARLEQEKKTLRDQLQQQAEASAVQRFIEQLKSGAKIQLGRGFDAGPAAS